jgi:multiple sugar transport system ATP-binding protein
MVRHPKAFLMDEPLSNLDARLRVQARAEISALHRRLGTTFLYVTHDQAEAMTMSDRVAVMAHGRILQLAAPQTLYDAPDSLEVARFVGSPRINTLPSAIAADGTLSVGPVAIARLAGAAPGPVTLGLRPEALSLAARGIPARVALIERLGPEAHAHLSLEQSDTPLVVRLSPAEASSIALDQVVQLRADPARALLFDEAGLRIPALLAAESVDA